MKVLVAEDDEKTAEFVRKGLVAEGHSVDCLSDGREALTYCLYNSCDLVILDRMLPGMDGLAVLRALRASGSQLPVIFLTALGTVEDRVDGLNAGSDDYLVKPFHFSELMARINAIIRRPNGGNEQTTLQVHDLELDLLSRTASRGGQTIELQAKEFGILEVLMRNAGRVVTKTMLLEQVWDFSFDPGTTIVETHISRLRAKIDKPFNVPLLHTTRNIGYSIHAPR
ncbi:response regulator transcription factor [Hoeflea sp. WL0058]|uniref:Response regulator transcription factor n=1 Tax=Flavimaribacter sediminis TaxID=2865987 RepID=A0AAE2ZL20_9HYPH|nr:response regulator transcription factor [Flavimaribacter sediminis]MBW8638009.1 response regulator transcription factor [Flavimaribacter sediminis]